MGWDQYQCDRQVNKIVFDGTKKNLKEMKDLEATAVNGRIELVGRTIKKTIKENVDIFGRHCQSVGGMFLCGLQCVQIRGSFGTLGRNGRVVY